MVCDRAMGKGAYLHKLLETKLRFLTALCEDDCEAYTDRIPHADLSGVEAFAEDGAQQASRAIEKTGMHRVNEKLYVLDLGVVRRRDESPACLVGKSGADAGAATPPQRFAASPRRGLSVTVFGW